MFKSLFGAAFLLLFTVPSHSGFMIILFLTAYIPFVTIKAIKTISTKQNVKPFIQSTAIWVLAIFASISINYYRHINMREEANNILVSIIKYKNINGHYPKNIDDIGISKSDMRSVLGASGYHNDNKGNILFFYAVPYELFTTYHYDFKNEKWIHIGD